MRAGGVEGVDGRIHGEVVVGVTVALYCDGSADHPHLEVGPIGYIDQLFDEDTPTVRMTDWTQLVSHAGVGAYDVQCDVCPADALLNTGSAGVRHLLDLARTLYEHGGHDQDEMPVRLRDIGRLDLL